MIKQAGHQVYVCLNAGIPHIREDPCEQTQLRKFEEAVLSCVSSGGSEALVDSGLGFWTEHRKLWGEGDWFAITSRDNEKVLACVLDRYIMRQKTMLSLTIHKDFQQHFEKYTHLPWLGIKFLGLAWPEDRQAVPEQDQGGDDEDTTQKVADETDWYKVISEELYKDTSIEKLSESYELEAQGQQRFWIRQRPENCCYASFKSSTGARCRKPAQCLFCCAKYTEDKDSQYGLFAHYTVAAVICW